MKFHEENEQALQKLELSVVRVWRANPEMTNYNAGRAYEAAFKYYRDQARGFTAKVPVFKGLDAITYEALTERCEVLLGRRAGPAEEKPGGAPVTLETLAACLRELGKSVERHTAHGGRQDYLTFIDRYLR